MEMNGLTDTYQAVQHGQTKIVMLKGEVGVGKTRLASEFLRRAENQGATILRSRAFCAHACPPYQPIVTAFCTHACSPYQPIIAALGDRCPAIPATTLDDTPASALPLYDAVTDAIAEIAAEHPVVFFIDAIQLADAGTLAMLQGIGSRLQARLVPVLLLLSLSQEALVTTPTLVEWSARMEQDLRAASITVNRLHKEDVLHFIRRISSTTTDATSAVSVEALGEWLFAETQGHPLSMIEVLDTLLDYHMLAVSARENGTWCIDLANSALNANKLQSLLPSNMRAVIRARLALLSPPARTLLAAGTIFTHVFTFEQTRRISGLEAREAEAALDEIVTHHLLEASGTGYFFTHDIIRDVVYAEMSEAQRTDLHRNLFRLLQEDLPNEPVHAAEKAYHAQACASWQEAFPLYVTAGDYSLRCGAVTHAMELYQHAGTQLILLRNAHISLFSIPQSLVYHFRLQSGLTYELAGKQEQAHALYSNMVIQAHNQGLVEEERVGLNHLARMTTQGNIDFALAQSIRRRMLQLNDNDLEKNSDLAIQAETEMHLARLTFYRFDAAGMHTHATRALTIARTLGLQEIAARSLLNLSYAAMLQGNWNMIIKYAEEARKEYSLLGNTQQEIRSLDEIARAYVSTGQWQQGLDYAREAYSLNEKHNTGLAYTAYHLVMGLLESGAYGEALSLARHAVNVARTQNQRIFLAVALTGLGTVYRTLLDLPAAYRIHSEAQTQYQILPQEPVVELSDADLCVDCMLTENWSEAYTHALQAINNRKVHAFNYQVFTRWYEIAALLRGTTSEQIERATQEVQRFEEQTHDNPRLRLVYLRMQTVLARHNLQSLLASEYLNEALELARKLHLPGELWTLEAELGDLYTLRDNQREARLAFGRSAEILRQLASTIDDERIRAHFLDNERVQQILVQ